VSQSNAHVCLHLTGSLPFTSLLSVVTADPEPLPQPLWPLRACSDDRYLLSYDERPRRVLGVLPIRGHGQLKLTLRDDAAPADILQGIMHAACFRRLLLDARRRDAQGNAGVTELPPSRVRVGEHDNFTLPVSSLLNSSRLTAQVEAAELMQHLPAQQWQQQPFLLSSSERGGYTLELD